MFKSLKLRVYLNKLSILSCHPRNVYYMIVKLLPKLLKDSILLTYIKAKTSFEVGRYTTTLIEIRATNLAVIIVQKEFVYSHV